MGSLGDDNVLCRVNTHLGDGLAFFLEDNRIQDHAIADYIDCVLAENSRRNGMEYKTLT